MSVKAYGWVVALVVGCVSPASVPCGDRVCPVSTTCVADQFCATSAQLEACEGLADSMMCTVNGAVGLCELGVCIAAGCGNKSVEVGEACDDGNQTSGDGCRADCRKIEMCGDEVVDDGEGCDDGNTNPSDGCDACTPTQWNATALIGSEGSGLAVALGRPADVAIDRDGMLYIVDNGNSRIRRLHPNGTQSLVAGIGETGFSGDGGPATSARFNNPQGITLDSVGNIYIADSSNSRIRKIDKSGTITTIAGNGTGVSGGGDNGPATLGSLNRPTGLAVDGLGNLYIAEFNANRVRRVDTNGIITTYAGTGVSGFSGDNGPANQADIQNPRGVAIDSIGNVYIACGTRVRKVDPSGTITTIAGTGTVGFSGDGGPATSAQLGTATRIALDAGGNIYITDTHNHRIRKIEGGIISTIAGMGGSGSAGGGFSGDGGPATSAFLRDPDGIAIDSNGVLSIADTTNNRIRRMPGAGGQIQTVAGTGQNGFTADGGPALSGRLLTPAELAIDASGTIYFTEQLTHRIRSVSPSGTLGTVAGLGTSGNTGDNGPATAAQFNTPYGIAVDGNVIYIADTQNHVIRKIENGTITRVAGTGTSGFSDNANPLQGQLNSPSGLAVLAGALYIADRGNNRIRKLDGNGLTTIAGTATNGYTGDGGPAVSAQLYAPIAIAFKNGELIFTDSNNHVVRKIDTNGDIDTIAGTGVSGFSGDGDVATNAQLSGPRGIAVDSTGNIYVTDFLNRRIRKIDTNGDIDTFAGTGTRGFSGDAAQATSARLDSPTAIRVDASGRIYFTDAQLDGMSLVRRIDTDGRIFTIAGLVDPAGIGPLATGALARPVAILRDAAFTIFAGGSSGVLQLLRPGATAIEIAAGRYPQSTPPAYAGGTPATADLARFQGSAFGSVDGVAYDAVAKRLFISQASTNSLFVIDVVDANDHRTWTIAPFANITKEAGYIDGAVASAKFREPTALLLAGTTLYVADTGNHAIRAIDLTGGLTTATVTTIAGIGAVRGYYGDGVPATTALLHAPRALARCPNGDLYIADSANNRIRRVSGGMITTIIGGDSPGTAGEGSPSTSFPIDNPLGITCDSNGNVFATSTNVVRLLPAGDDGIVDGTGAVQTIYALPPRQTFPASAASCLTGITTVNDSTVQLVDSCTGLLVELVRAPAQ